MVSKIINRGDNYPSDALPLLFIDSLFMCFVFFNFLSEIDNRISICCRILKVYQSKYLHVYYESECHIYMSFLILLRIQWLFNVSGSFNVCWMCDIFFSNRK